MVLSLPYKMSLNINPDVPVTAATGQDEGIERREARRVLRRRPRELSARLRRRGARSAAVGKKTFRDEQSGS